MSAIIATLQANKTRTRNPWPVGIVLFFVIFISSMAAWITVALRNDMDLVRKDYYEQEILFQKQIDRVHRTAGLAVEMKLDFEVAAARLLLQLPPEHTPGGVSGVVHLYRPSDAKLDQHFPLAVSRDGTQVFDLASLAPGLWKVQVSWRADGADFFCAKQIVIGSK